MRFKKVFFVIPNLKGFYGWPNYPHPGVGYLSTFLETKGIEYNVLDMNLAYKTEDLKKKIKSFNPDLIAITMYTYKHSQTYRMIDQIKKFFNIPIVVGGPHVSLFKSKVLDGNLIDFAIQHEGEEALFELCLGKPLKDIDNLIYRHDGTVCENPSREFNQDLDRLPFPRFSRFELEKYGTEKTKDIGLVSSRGCPYHCIYCPIMTTMGRNFRSRSPENVVSEIIYWHEKGYQNFEFVDDTFLQNNERVLQLCDLIEKAGLNKVFFNCSQGIRANRITRPLLERMKEIGFRCLGFGVESASNKVLKCIKKGQLFEQIDEGVRIACELGYDVRLFFMLGFPEETMEDAEQSFKFALKYPVSSANFYNIIPYPGTELFDYLKKNKLFLIEPDVYLNEVITRMRRPVFQTESMSLAERKTVLKKGYAISRKISYRHRKEQFKKFGFTGAVLAFVLSSSLLYHKIGRIKQYRMVNLFWGAFSGLLFNTCWSNNFKNIFSSVILSGISCLIFPQTVIRRYQLKNSAKHKLKKILIIAINQGLGNLVLHIPMLRRLHQEFPSTELTILVNNEAGKNFLVSQQFISQVKVFPFKEVNFIKGLTYFWREIRPECFSLSIFTYCGNYFYYSLWPFLAGIRWRIAGYRAQKISFLDKFVNTFVFDWRDDQHEGEQYLKLLTPFIEGDGYADENKLSVSSQAISFAEDYFKTNNLYPEAAVLGIHPGSAQTTKWKRCPLEKFLQVAEEYENVYNRKVIFFIGEGETELIPKIHSSGHNFLVFHNSDIEKVAAVIKKCGVFLGNDSALIHIANFLGVPVVAIFGPTLPEKNSPWKGRYQVVRNKLLCGPCYQFEMVKCSQRKCLDNIEVKEVLTAIQKLIEKNEYILN